ncbi:hypothetical protein B0H11DRAFT_1013022 [Mycena galericulata]|nr:hypothetical protein B0H11DRAFT_1013022 [Mycena galericulata]
MPFGHRGGEGEHNTIDRVGVFTLLATLVKPKSFGSVRLASVDPHIRAQVDLGYFSDPEDLIVARKTDLIVPDSEKDESLDQFVRNVRRLSRRIQTACSPWRARCDGARPFQHKQSTFHTVLVLAVRQRDGLAESQKIVDCRYTLIKVNSTFAGARRSLWGIHAESARCPASCPASSRARNSGRRIAN